MGQLDYLCLFGIDKQPILITYPSDVVQEPLQELLAFMDDIDVIHIPSVVFHAPHNLAVVVYPCWIVHTGYLRYLASNAYGLFHVLLACQLCLINFSVFQCVVQGIHAVSIFFLRHVRNIHPEGVYELLNKAHGLLIANLFPHLLYQPIMWDVVKEFAETNQ